MIVATYVIKQYGVVSIGKFFLVFGLVWGIILGFFVAAAVISMGSVVGTHALGFAGGIVVLGLITLK
jgi:hypothetical protein